ncbi:inorganic diphosphatase [Mycotypha africana]|uniref:inorganic diphosphatase n=1 Tax=Mycotypha africana TaxID=64632 RepID=UPI0022FFE124|nr:inorganic diphosphatase [Mycotypha africana]KAI8987970.1 inorganic diphosphatase [Mycotypha africana]
MPFLTVLLQNKTSMNKAFVRFSSTFKTVHVGKPFTASHRVYYEKDGQIISPWHDVPLYSDEKNKHIVNMIVEIPRWTNSKVEIAVDEKFNPLKHDIKKGKPRFVRNCFPCVGYSWNYGALPQTWEDPTYVHNDTFAKGDNDPIDVLDIGEAIAKQGEVKQVKVLGIMALLDEGETDWKVISIDTRDPLADKLNNIQDVQEHFPGLIDTTRKFFRVYKVPDGKPENAFAFNGECKDKDYAHSVIEETHEAWKRLIQNKVLSTKDTKGIGLANISVKNSPYKEEPQRVTDTIKEEKFEFEQEKDNEHYDSRWYFV